MPGTALAADYASLSEALDPSTRPWLERPDVDVAALDDDQRTWRERGALVLPKAVPDALIDAYVERFRRYHNVEGFRTPTPYELVPELREIALYRPILDKIDDLIGDEMILHLNLTPWVSTQRAWHQDDYLNPPGVDGWYVAVWVALADIEARSGPFEYIPGSHRWPVLRRERVKQLMTAEQAREDAASPQSMWTAFTEPQVADAVERKRVAEGAPVERFLGRKGDVLIWHACLQHRGSRPEPPRKPTWRRGIMALPPRPALISHYTARSHYEVPDANLATHTTGGRYTLYNNALEQLDGGPPAGLDKVKKRIRWYARRR